MSTTGPDVVPTLSTAVTAAGGRFVNAPILGTPPIVRSGGATVLLGGSNHDLADATTVLCAMGLIRRVNSPAAAARSRGVALRARARGPRDREPRRRPRRPGRPPHPATCSSAAASTTLASMRFAISLRQVTEQGGEKVENNSRTHTPKHDVEPAGTTHQKAGPAIRARPAAEHVGDSAQRCEAARLLDVPRTVLLAAAPAWAHLGWRCRGPCCRPGIYCWGRPKGRR